MVQKFTEIGVGILLNILQKEREYGKIK